MEKYPNDIDGNILRNLEKSGIDMNKSLDFEFFIDSPDENSSIQIEKQLIKEGFSTEIYFDEGELDDDEPKTAKNKEFWPSWTVYVFSNMLPRYSEIMRIQTILDNISKAFNGKSDGWEIKSTKNN